MRSVLDHRHATFVVAVGERFLQHETHVPLSEDELCGQVWCIPKLADARRAARLAEKRYPGETFSVYMTDAEDPLDVLVLMPSVRKVRPRRVLRGSVKVRRGSSGSSASRPSS
jgi:hypothetical protein